MPDVGAGSFDAGDGPAGWDPTPGVVHRPTDTRVAAPLFDPQTRRYPMDANGALVAEHFVIARARHLLGIRRRGIPSAPTVGIPLGGIRTASKEGRQRAIEDAVRIALKPLLDDEDIAIVRVVLSSPFDGTFYTDIQNLREPNKPATRITSSAQD